MHRVLIVDDDPSVLCVLSNLLQSEDYDVIATLRGDKAVTILKSDEDIDVMISDIRMNPLAGTELLKMSREVRPNMPVIMLTAFFSKKSEAEALKMGAFDYIKKPWDIEELLETVKRAIESEQ